MLRYLFEGYADTIMLAITLRAQPAGPVSTITHSRPAAEFMEIPGDGALLHGGAEPTAKPRSRSWWFALGAASR